MSNPTKRVPQPIPLTLFDLLTFLRGQIANQPELANLVVAGLEIPLVLTTSMETAHLPPDTGIMKYVNDFYSALDDKVEDSQTYIDKQVLILSPQTREDIAEAAATHKKGLH